MSGTNTSTSFCQRALYMSLGLSLSQHSVKKLTLPLPPAQSLRISQGEGLEPSEVFPGCDTARAFGDKMKISTVLSHTWPSRFPGMCKSFSKTLCICHSPAFPFELFG